MKILSAAEIREWDQYTIAHEPISSIALMERAATACANWIVDQYPDALSFGIFCGKGNNGGDGLAIARLLLERKYRVSVHILEFGHKGTDDFQINLAKLHQLPAADIHFIQSIEHIHPVPAGQIMIDALLGSGLNRALEGLTASVVEHLNQSGATVVSIDIPSGMFTDRSSKGVLSVRATHTLSFQCYKPAFLFAENADCTGEIHILEIGLHPHYYAELQTENELLERSYIQQILQPRKRFAHKGNFGHALIVAGSYGKMGAAVLAARSCLRSGTGLVSCYTPSCGVNILQTSVPEAMVKTDREEKMLTHLEDDLSVYDAIGVGPGIGTLPETTMMLRELLDAFRSPLVLDADALNILSTQKDLLQMVPPGSILSPHPKEFERLFGTSSNDFDRAALALQKAREGGWIIILKGHHTLIASPDGKGYFNSTGNPGMATGGSGDVLTGILTGLLAQGYAPLEAALLGVNLHGLAGDLAATELSMEALLAGDIIQYIGRAFKHLKNK